MKEVGGKVLKADLNAPEEKGLLIDKYSSDL
jgi:hypothetical protein